MTNDDIDSVKAFCLCCVEKDLSSRVGTTVLYGAYLAWALDAGAHELSHKAFTLALKQLGLAKKKSDVLYWLDLSLTPAGRGYADQGRILLPKRHSRGRTLTPVANSSAPVSLDVSRSTFMSRWWHLGRAIGRRAAEVLARFA